MVRVGLITVGLVVLMVVTLGGLLLIGVLSVLPLWIIGYWQHQSRVNKYRVSAPKEMMTQLMQSGSYHFLVKRTGITLSTDILPETLNLLDDSGFQDLLNSTNPGVAQDEEVLSWVLNQPQGLLVLDQHRLTSKDVDRIISWHGLWWRFLEQSNSFWNRGKLLSTPALGRWWSFGYTPMLDTVAHDVSVYEQVDFHSVGRDAEIVQIAQLLSLPRQPLVLLSGSEGTGRHAVINGLLSMVAKHRVSSLEYYRFVSLHIESFLASNSNQSAHLQQIFAEAALAGNVVLILEGVDRLVNHPNTADFLKVLSGLDGSLRLPVLAVTDEATFYDQLAHHNELMKLFTHISLLPMTMDQAFEVAVTHLFEFEVSHKADFTYQGMKRLFEILNTYVTHEVWPEKAIDGLSLVFAEAERLETDLITPELVETVYQAKLHIPLDKPDALEGERLVDLEQRLRSLIVDQDPAIVALAKALRRNRAGVGANPHKPQGSFLFLGPTGVGKTYTAKMLSRLYFQTEELMRLDMAEYQADNAVERLLGTKSSAGDLASKISKRPYGVLLLDEFEKAPREVHNLFLRILDEGSFTSTNGKIIDCKQLMIIATSNAGSELIRKMFEQSQEYVRILEAVTTMLIDDNIFSPELLNRFDSTVLFTPFSNDNMARIIAHELNRLSDSLRETKQIQVSYSRESVDKIFSNGYESRFGARSITRYIQSSVEDAIATALLKNPDLREIDLDKLSF